MRRILFDVEGNGLLPELTKLHCICCVDVDTEETHDFGPDQLKEGTAYLATADLLIAHFGIGYDFPALLKTLGFEVVIDKQSDTVVLARIKRPNIKELDKRWNDTRLKKGEPTMGDQFGKHTIEAWGIRLGRPKLHTDIEDWSEWSPEIQERCHGDVQTGLALWKYLDPDKMSKDAIDLEHRTQRLTNKITEAGWPFNVKKATALYEHLVDERFKTETKLKEQFGGWWKPKKAKKLTKKEFIAQFPSAKRIPLPDFIPKPFVPVQPNKRYGYWGEYKDVPDQIEPVFEGYPCTQIEWCVFNPGSRKHIERCLRLLGWEPTEFTENGNPKLDEEVLDGIATVYDEAEGLTHYLMLDKRIGQLATGEQAWLKAVTPEGFVHPKYNPIGTVTSRAAHYDFNVGQVPAVGKPYGKECRECFEVLPGFTLLGADMDGLEGRCQAHYMARHDGGEFGEKLLAGDPHWENVLALGLLPPGTERITDKDHPLYKLHKIVRDDGAKRWYYAWIYGSGKEKSGRIILECARLAMKTNPEWGFIMQHYFGDVKAPKPKLLKKIGAELQEAFLEATPALAAVIRIVKSKAMKFGKLPGLDGRIIPIRSDHSAFNALLQSAGAILCKRWMCDAYDALIAAGFKWGWKGDFVILGWIHDELQIAVREGLEEKVGAIVVKAAQEAGKPYGFRIRLDSSFKTGSNWAETH